MSLVDIRKTPLVEIAEKGVLGEHDIAEIDRTVEAEDGRVEHVEAVGNMTLHPTIDSWCMGSNVPGKPRGFMAYIVGVGVCPQRCDDVAASASEGFAVTRRARRSER